MRRFAAFAVLILVSVPLPSMAQTVPVGYRIHVPDRTVELALVQDSPSPFHAVITRSAGSADDEWRLRLAEAVHPAGDSLPSLRWCVSRDTAAGPWRPGCRPPVPQALTATVVRQYLDWIAALRRGDPLSGHGLPLSASVSLGYEATGHWETEFGLEDRRYADVYVVRLRLQARTRGWAFTKDRVVVLSRAGDVLAVTGDGPTIVIISH